MEITYALIPVILTIIFFITRNAVLGWLCVPFWFTMAAYAYSESGVPTGGAFDLEYGLMWGAVACGIALSLYAFSIGRKEDLDEDELPDNTPYVDGSREQTNKSDKSQEESNKRVKRIQRKRKEKRAMARINRRG